MQCAPPRTQALLNRTNTLTGVTYRDESAIMAFELINEPRIPQDDGSGDTFQTWVEVAAGAFKSLDSNHLLGIGSEGFFGASTPELLGSNPYSRASAGTDFSRNAAAPGIDFAVAHAYPDQWMPSSSFDTQVNFVGAWYRAHVLEAQRINKNFLLEEFGCDRANDLDNRNTFFATVYDTSFQLLREGYGACAGELFWLLSGSDSAPDYDGYSVRPDDASTIALIQSQAARMKSLVAPPPQEAATPAAAAAGPAQAAAPLASL
jgi:mannan endo-1,4-beta-mannosidase